MRMIKWIRTGRWSIKNSLSFWEEGRTDDRDEAGHEAPQVRGGCDLAIPAPPPILLRPDKNSRFRV